MVLAADRFADESNRSVHAIPNLVPDSSSSESEYIEETC